MNPRLTFCFLAIVCLVRGDNVQLLSSASSNFSQHLYQKIALHTKNAIYSPYSIHSALTMTSLGAKGKTLIDMKAVLGLESLPSNSVHGTYHELIIQLNGVKDVKLYTANAIFANPKIQLKQPFVNKVKENYLALVSNFDLAAKEGREKTINDFVNNKTQGRIKDLIAKGSIDSQTELILVNTIFFSGTWDNRFEESKTSKQVFHQLGGAQTRIDMMYSERHINIKRNVNGVDVAELPFHGKRFSLYIALPQKTDGIEELETSLSTPQGVDQLFEGLTKVYIQLYIPKFKIESSYKLKSPLQQLGMGNAFDPKYSNFRTITNDYNVYISDVIHKAIIEVKENGTVAAAATGVIIRTRSARSVAKETFKANHPFVFFVRDNKTKNILLQGKFSG